MANYATLKAAIQAAIRENGNNEITGPLLQQTLISLVNSLGAGYQFAGVPTTTTDPGTPDYNVMYIAGPGYYEYFGQTTIQTGELGIFRYNGSWVRSVIQLVPSSAGYVTLNTTQTITGAKTFSQSIKLAGSTRGVNFNDRFIIAPDGIIEGAGMKLCLTDPDNNPVGLTNIATPTDASDAVNKSYVDTIVGNIDTLLQALL